MRKFILVFLVVIIMFVFASCDVVSPSVASGSAESTESIDSTSEIIPEYNEVSDIANACSITDDLDLDSVDEIINESPDAEFEFGGKTYSLAYSHTNRHNFYGYDMNVYNVSDNTIERLYIYSENKGFEICFERQYVEELTEKIAEPLNEEQVIAEARKTAEKYVDFGKGEWICKAEVSGTVNGRTYYDVSFKLALGEFVTSCGVDVGINDAGIVNRVKHFTGNVDTETVVPKIDEESLTNSFRELSVKHLNAEEKEITGIDYYQVELYVNSSGKVCVEYMVCFECDIDKNGDLRLTKGKFRCTAIFN